MAIEFQQPGSEEIKAMKEFASIVDQGLELLNSSGTDGVSHIVAKKLQEAMMWFSHGLLNKPADIVDEVVHAAESAGDALGDAANKVGHAVEDAANAIKDLF